MDEVAYPFANSSSDPLEFQGLTLGVEDPVQPG